MANLFGKNKLRDIAQKINTESVLDHISIIKEWHHDYHDGSLRQDKETSREQQYNRDFFLDILGYKEKPATPFSFEPKATTDKGQLPDAVISYTDKQNDIANIAAVVELKGAAIDLDRPQRREGNLSPVQQAFKYKTQYRNCPFVIASNFWEFRLYRDNLLDYEAWTLDDLVNPDDDYILFKTWYALLNHTNFTTPKGASKTEALLSDIRIEQENIGKKFYKVYKEARLDLLRDIYKHNDHIKTDIDTGIEKAQKIVDRIVFAAFAEDRGLLPDNTLQRVIKATDSSAFGGSLWNTLKGFFEAIDRGSDRLEIPDGYNGGLFKYDELLNNLQISDEPLRKVVELGTYNFAEDLSVNILGHIFEQSISDLEEIKNKVSESQSLETISQSRRKKDGIFYTPDYIVRYIVDNSLGAYLREHEDKFKSEFGLKGDITDKTYEKREKKAYAKYQDFLQNVKVVDPACGSGAFLVYVFDYLLAENKRVGDILGNTLFSADAYVRDILRNNIYGVDLNEESVEITKLSLWLKSAQKGKKLTALDDNIKCGNSLIDDEQIASKKAFDWSKEFTDIMQNGGFDIVIGNPPYVQLSEIKTTTEEEKKYLLNRYMSSMGRLNTFAFFVALAMDICKRDGFTNYIIPNTILTQEYYKQIRKRLLDEAKVEQIVQFKELPFADAVVENIILAFRNKTEVNSIVEVYESRIGTFELVNKIHTNFFLDSKDFNFNIFYDPKTSLITDKMDNISVRLDTISEVNQAIALRGSRNLWVHDSPKPDYKKLLVGGKNINRYYLEWTGEYLDHCPEAIHSCNRTDIFESKEKLFFRRVSNRLIATYDDQKLYGLHTLVVINLRSNYASSYKIKYVLGLFNSKLLNFYYLNKFISTKTVFTEIGAQKVRELPISNATSNEQDIVVNYVDQMLTLNLRLSEQTKRFQSLVSGEFKLEKWPTKLNRWWTLDFTDFVSALKLQLTLQQKDELLQLFEKYRTELAELDNQIQKTDQEIDQLVYKLYNLTPEEITIVEAC